VVFRSTTEAPFTYPTVQPIQFSRWPSPAGARRSRPLSDQFALGTGRSSPSARIRTVTVKSPSTRFQRLDALRALRSLLLRVVERLSADTRLTGGDLRDLNRAIADPVRARLEPAPNGGYQVDMQALASSWREFAVRELAGSFVALLRRSHPPRINVCANGDCRRAFYDETKSRTRRWCDSSTCGNRIRVRRHRARGRV
jgi:predicted RNA-binding Zn ribbon-like protein